MSIKSLGYLGFGVRDVEAWRSYLTRKLGLMEGRDESGGIVFRVDSRAWRIAVHEGVEDDLAYTGYEVANELALADMVQRLRSEGVDVIAGDVDLAKQRGVLGLVSFNDPFGLRIEVYYGGSEVFEQPFVSGSGVSGFVTGDQGLGHCVLSVPDASRALDFYTKVMGFKLSDVIDMKIGPERTVPVHFMHCNGRHHTLAVAALPLPKRLHHFMLEVKALDDVGHAFDRLDADDLITMTLGRHTNDHMVSFYASTPSGIEVEYGWGARVVDDTSWVVARHDRISIWGHKSVRKQG
nr:Biphenyl-2,3-diol 1,2-dioxygenase [Paraburkholderia sp.]